MTINDIMLRDIAEAKRKEREREEAKADWRRDMTTKRDRWRWNVLECAAFLLAIATLAFLAWCLISDTPHRRGFFGGNESRTEQGAPAK